MYICISASDTERDETQTARKDERVPSTIITDERVPNAIIISPRIIIKAIIIVRQ
jgi:hypothetical protein